MEINDSLRSSTLLKASKVDTDNVRLTGRIGFTMSKIDNGFSKEKGRKNKYLCTVPVVYIVRDEMIAMRENSFLGPVMDLPASKSLNPSAM
jgi:hypothetical protein